MAELLDRASGAITLAPPAGWHASPPADAPDAAEAPAPPRSLRWTLGRAALLGAVLAYLALVLVLPLAALAVRGVSAGLGAALREVAAPEARGGLAMSLALVVAAVLVNGVVGVAGALVLVRQRFPGRAVVDALVDLPLAISPVMTGLAMLLIFGRAGWLHPALDAFGIQVAFAPPGMFVATLFVTLPLTLREVSHVLAELGTTEEESAVTLGASPWQTFRLVTLPNVGHALRYGVTLTAARALGEFGAVLVVGGAISGRTQTATTFVYAALEERNEAAAYGMALLLAAASMALLIILERVKRTTHGGRES